MCASRHEYQIVNIKGYLIPLGDLPTRIHELDSSREIVVHCKSGMRSAKGRRFPAAKSGFQTRYHLTGRYSGLARPVDKTLAKILITKTGSWLVGLRPGLKHAEVIRDTEDGPKGE